LWGQKFARELKTNSPALFDQAYNEWIGVAAVKSDLIDLNLISINSIKVNQINFNNINNMMLKFNQILKNFNNLSAESQTIQEKINDELNQIISNILSELIFSFDFNIFNLLLHSLFFEKFDRIFKDFEKNFNIFLQFDQINQLNQFENIWKSFIQDTNDIYILIADIFWKNKRIFIQIS